MKSYFSRLMKQTGITVSPTENVGSGARGQSGTASEHQNNVTPIHIDETRLVEPPQDQVAERTSESIREGLENEDVRHLTEGSFEKRISEEPQTHTLEEKSEAHDRDILSSSENARTQPEVLESEETIESNTVSETPSRDSDGAFTSEDGKGNQDFPSKFEAELGEARHEIDQIKMRQALLEKVREWVAETPVESERADLKDGDQSSGQEPGATDERMSAIHGEDALSTAFHPRSTESRQSEAPEIQDLHLTIGTISLTIEEPQRENWNDEPLRVERQKKPARESGSSRLNRHYIRIR